MSLISTFCLLLQNVVCSASLQMESADENKSETVESSVFQGNELCLLCWVLNLLFRLQISLMTESS